MSDIDREAFERIERQFTSGNSVPVERASVRKEDWEAVKRYAARQAPASGEVEPVAWMGTSNDGDLEYGPTRQFVINEAHAFWWVPSSIVPLYTHPPAKVPEAGEIVDRVVAELEAGFVACRRCGDQEDTSTLDCMADLKRLQALLTTPTPATTAQPTQQGVPEGLIRQCEQAIEDAAQNKGGTINGVRAAQKKVRDLLSTTPEPEGDGWKLPYDVVINGGMTFRKGVKLSTFVKAAERWHRDTMKQYAGISKEDIEALLHPTQPPKEGE